mmetsp:Transcript_24367/g.45749  ORF Transcript_24367/g.45749 Transcript_24367/m.45749 type:complete len:487 (-) Transcript_24367:1158-2618(-)
MKWTEDGRIRCFILIRRRIGFGLYSNHLAGRVVLVDEDLEVLPLLELLLVDEVVELEQPNGDVLVALAQPRDLPLALLDVSVRDEVSLDDVPGDSGDLHHSPAHEPDQVSDLDSLDVAALDHQITADLHEPLSDLGELGVVVGGDENIGLRPLDVAQLDLLLPVGRHGHEPLGSVVDRLLVLGPELAPLHQRDPPRRALSQNVAPQSFDVDAPPHDAPDGGEPGVVPPGDVPVVGEPGELALAQLRVHEVHPGESVDPDSPEKKRVLNPRVLLVPVVVLGGPEGVGDSLDAVHDGTGEVVGGVGLVGGAGAVVGGQVLAVQHGIAHGAVDALHVDLGPEAPLGALGVSAAHEVEELHVLLHAKGAPRAVLPVHALLLHRLLGGVVHEGESLLDHLDGVGLHLLKVVGGVGDDVGVDSELAEILDDALLEFFLLLGGIGVVKPNDQLALVPPGVVVVQEDRLGVSDVEVARGFGGEPGGDLEGHSAL